MPKVRSCKPLPHTQKKKMKKKKKKKKKKAKTLRNSTKDADKQRPASSEPPLLPTLGPPQAPLPKLKTTTPKKDTEKPQGGSRNSKTSAGSLLGLAYKPNPTPSEPPPLPIIDPPQAPLPKPKTTTPKKDTERSQRCNRKSRNSPLSLLGLVCTTSLSPVQSYISHLSAESRESIRWEGVLNDPLEEENRLEVYRANRRQRYINHREMQLRTSAEELDSGIPT